ncbi:MAG: CTP synthase, partial [Mycobacterium sp.]|nr:CTP synthase [Mycobacterium sp.]
ELKSRPTRPHPLFVAFVGAAIDYKAAERLPVEIPEHSGSLENSGGSDHSNGHELAGDSGAQPLSEHTRG